MSRGILPLVLDDVCFDAGGERLIDRLTLTLEAGPRTMILGPNGAGKSLFLRLCHGLLRPTAGTVRWRGPGAATALAHQAMVFQSPVMLRRSAAANVAYALAVRGVARTRRGKIVARALARVGLEDAARQPARTLSLGEQQRLSLARVWALEPHVLFLDEPTASLDPAATRAVEAAIDAIHRAGAKIVMTTHDLGQAHRLADEILFLHRGRLVERSPADAFFAGPQSPEAAAFLKGELLW
ncbi:MAG: ATP-binding cassette domain-containing protein [Alphaproteobacteria bacterium]